MKEHPTEPEQTIVKVLKTISTSTVSCPGDDDDDDDVGGGGSGVFFFAV